MSRTLDPLGNSGLDRLPKETRKKKGEELLEKIKERGRCSQYSEEGS